MEKSLGSWYAGVFGSRRETYKKALIRGIEQEKRLLANRDIQQGQEYENDRVDIFEEVNRVIHNRLKDHKWTKVLEIGGGVGIVSQAIARQYLKDYASLDMTMTSLVPLTEHKGVKESGVTVYTGVLAERLPRHWSDQFDIVFNDSVLGWCDIPTVLAEIKRVLKPGGIWIGYEGAVVRTGFSGYELMKELLPIEMDELGMKNNNGWLKMLWMEKTSNIYPIKYIKPFDEKAA